MGSIVFAAIRALVAVCLVAVVHTVMAQNYPAKRIRLITPVAAGSSTDILARLIAQKMTERWGQQVVVDNRVGAGSVVGATLGAQAPADGYTLTMAPSSAFAIKGIVAPAKTPNATLDKLHAEMMWVLHQADVKERFDTLAFAPAGMSRAEFAAYIKTEIAKWSKVARDSGAKAD